LPIEMSAFLCRWLLLVILHWWHSNDSRSCLFTYFW